MSEKQENLLGKKLYEHRTKLKLTQDAVAEAVGISRVALTRYENGTRIPKTDIIFRLASFYGINVSELVENEKSFQTQEQNPDEDLWELREMLRRDPERRMLFDAARDVRKEDIMTAVRILDALKGGGDSAD